MRIDGAHLAELRQVDAHVGNGEVANELGRGRAVLGIFGDEDAFDVEVALERGNRLAEQVEAAAARQERRELVRVDFEFHGLGADALAALHA